MDTSGNDDTSFERRSLAVGAMPSASRAAGGAWADARFVLLHGWLPLAGFALLAGLLLLSNGDAWWADRLYAWEGHRWALKSSFATEQFVHCLGHDASVVAWVGVVVAWLLVRTRPGLARWRGPLARLALSVLLATTCVAWFKSWSNMDCPWDLLRYGGGRPYVGLLQLRPVGLSRGACFPAGHASAGYAWMALYFLFLDVRPRWRWWGLALGAGSGLLFGLSQQLRGAHFLSHDLWAAAICWAIAFATYRALRSDESFGGCRAAAPFAAGLCAGIASGVHADNAAVAR